LTTKVSVIVAANVRLIVIESSIPTTMSGRAGWSFFSAFLQSISRALRSPQVRQAVKHASIFGGKNGTMVSQSVPVC
jgi:hypothetical protein